MWCSGAVAHLLQGSMYYLLLVVMSSFLSYCWLATSSVQSGNSPLTSGINNSCSPRELPLTGYSLDRLERIVWNMRKILADQKFMKYSDQPIWQHIPCYFFSLGWRVWTSAVHLDMLQCIKLLPWDWPIRYVHLTFEQAYLIKWLIRADKLFFKDNNTYKLYDQHFT